MRTFFTVFLGGLVGVAAVMLYRALPMGEAADQFVFQLLGKDSLSTIISPDGSQLLGIVLAFAIAWIVYDVPRAAQRWLLAGLTVLLLFTGAFVLSLHDVIFSPVAPAFATLVAFFATSALTRVGPGAHKRRVDSLFGSNVSRKMLGALYNSPASLVSSARKAKAAVLTLTVSNHRALMDAMSPEDFAAMNRMVFSMASDYLCEAGAYLETSSATMIRAVIGAPIAEELPAVRACRVALELARRLERLNLEADSRFHHLIEFHIGIATGDVVCGGFGAPRGAGYSVVGTPVSRSAQLSSAGAVYGCTVLCCMQTQQQAAETIEVRPIDLVRDDEGEPTEIYEILALKGALSPERQRSRDHFWNGINHTRARRWDEAVAEFTKARIPGIPDPALDFHLRRVEVLRNARPGMDSTLPLF